VVEMEILKCRYTSLKRNKDIPSEKKTGKISGYSMYMYEIQEQKEAPAWYTGIYRTISSIAW